MTTHEETAVRADQPGSAETPQAASRAQAKTASKGKTAPVPAPGEAVASGKPRRSSSLPSNAQPLPEAAPGDGEVTPKGKLGVLVALLRQEGGVTVEAAMAATGWQAHSVRGAIAGQIKKGLGLSVISEKIEGVRRYRIAKAAQ